ncbi:MAG TPA: FAD-dependent oxidoreductase, partial [Anaerolineae bacterium]
TASEANAAQLRSEVAMLRGIGVNTRIVSADELRELQPAARIDDVALAAYEPDAGYADPVAATQTLAARAKDLGVTFKTGTYVKSIRVDHDRVTGVDTNVGLIETLTVVVMAGPWSDRLLKPLGVKLELEFRRAEVAFFERPPELKAGHAAFLDTITGAHFRPHTFGLTMGGLTAPPPGSLKNPDQFDESVSREAAADVRQRIAARLPAMANARFTRGHAGVYDMTADGHAVLGRAPAIHGLVIAAGFSGTGFALAPAVGACIGELIADGEARMVDLNAFRLERFRASKQESK